MAKVFSTAFALNGVRASQQKLPEPQYVFDDAKHRFHGGFVRLA